MTFKILWPTNFTKLWIIWMESNQSWFRPEVFINRAFIWPTCWPLFSTHSLTSPQQPLLWRSRYRKEVFIAESSGRGPPLHSAAALLLIIYSIMRLWLTYTIHLVQCNLCSPHMNEQTWSQAICTSRKVRSKCGCDCVCFCSHGYTKFMSCCAKLFVGLLAYLYFAHKGLKGHIFHLT